MGLSASSLGIMPNVSRTTFQTQETFSVDKAYCNIEYIKHELFWLKMGFMKTLFPSHINGGGDTLFPGEVLRVIW